jgi:malate permease and related proteins
MFEALRAFSEVLLPVIIVVMCGYLLGRSFSLDVRTLNRVSLYILSPCLVFVTLLRAEVASGAATRLVLQMIVVMSCTLIIGYLVSLGFKLTAHQRSGFLLTTTFMNSGNFGLSVTRFAFGDIGFQFAILGYLTQAILSQTLAVYLASAGSKGRWAALQQVFRVPLIYALLLALILRSLGIRLDEVNGPIAVGIYRGLRLLADATLPLLLLILGTQLINRGSVQATAPLIAATIIRLMVSIPVAYGAGLAVGLSGLPLIVGVIQAAMPTAVNMTVLALEFDAWPEFVSRGVIVTTLGSLITLTILIAAVR